MATAEQTRMVHTADGRELCVEVAGDGTSGTVIVLGGSPNSRHLDRPWVEDALKRGLRLVGHDRPGYGGSSPRPGRTVADGAQDVRAIASDLGVDRIGVWGFSGGGPYALACAALLPDLVAAAGTIGSLAPYGAPGLDYFTGMGEDNVEDFKLTLSDPDAARQKADNDWEEMMQVTPEGIQEALKSLLSPVDAAVLTGEFAESLVRNMKDGLAPGVQGWWDDGLAHISPWGFDLDAIQSPVKIWHGREDRFVPFQHGQWLVEHVPGAESGLSDTDGHLSLLVDVGYVHAWLLEHM